MRSPVALPEAAAAKLDSLTMARDAALDAARSCSSRLSMSNNGDTRMREALAAEQAKHNARHTQLARLVSAVNQFRMELPAGAVLEMVPPVSVDLKGETPSDAVAATREQIASTKQQLQATRSAPLPLDHQHRLVAEAVADRARAGRPTVSIANDEARISWCENTSSISVLAWLLPQQMADLLSAGLQEAPNALSAEERRIRISELESTLLSLERQEESLITAAAASGQEILRRPDASPLAVLNVAPVANNSRAVERSAA